MELQLAANQPGFTQKEVRIIPWRGWLKLFYSLAAFSLILAGAIYIPKEILKKRQITKSENLILTANYQNRLWENYGSVFEPLISLSVYYPQTGYQNEQFLLDSGAIISSLPREKAAQLGYSLARLPRTTFIGFGGATSFAYQASVNIMLGNQQAKIPIVFTEAAGTKSILGRLGFFDNYSVYFNSRAKVIEISQ